MKGLRLFVIALVALIAVPAFAQDKSANNMEILRQKIKADKKLLVAVNMDLTESEAKGFWPVYDAYQADLQVLNERIGKLVVQYADLYNSKTLTDDTAKSLLDEALAIDQAEVSMRQGYVPKLAAVLPFTKVARYLQIENKIRAVIKYELADGIPLAR
jgi:cell division protein FtsB